MPSKSTEDNIVASVDIGSYKTCCVIARVNSKNDIEILGAGQVLSEGIKRGTIVNIHEASNSISKAVEEAEIMAGIQINSVYLGLSSIYCEGINTKSVVAVNNKEREITDNEVRRAINSATERVVPMNKEVIHVIPQQYSVDNQDGIKNPLGMNGTRLEVSLRIINANVTQLQNLIKAVSKANLAIRDFSVGSIAEGELLLTEEEKDLGVVLIDIGGGTTETIGYYNGSVWFNGAIPLGGIDITSDISSIFKTTLQQSEKIKKLYGHSSPISVDTNETIEIQMINKRVKSVKRVDLAKVIEARVEEIFSEVKKQLESSGMYEIATAGIVLTGGSSLIPGIEETAENIFDLPCRIGYIENIGGLSDTVKNPIYAKAVGMIYYSVLKSNVILQDTNSKKGEFFKKVKDFINNFFFGE
ncbi:MAG: cell division protein FtsA [Spirochaetia bacterium]|nr:cell division protein FtsA [Spirochaetota bacterium]MCX8095979.1 cell division protein FtsA [Spirochaetota bacterium]MDW8113034.1 cell division protein FtsA [Spirochaetia bacterium]